MKLTVAAVAVVATVAEEVWRFVQTGVLGAAAFVGACVTLWVFIIRPASRNARELLHHARQVFTVILGDDGHPSLVDRLERGEGDFCRIEAKVDDVRHDISGDNGIKRRLTQVERTIGVMGDVEALHIKQSIAAATPPDERRST